eukprot:scaffold6446_cov104-Isochrysis_galbana.AAC.8
MTTAFVRASLKWKATVERSKANTRAMTRPLARGVGEVSSARTRVVGSHETQCVVSATSAPDMPARTDNKWTHTLPPAVYYQA